MLKKPNIRTIKHNIFKLEIILTVLDRQSNLDMSIEHIKGTIKIVDRIGFLYPKKNKLIKESQANRSMVDAIIKTSITERLLNSSQRINDIINEEIIRPGANESKSNATKK